jgi:hypothetical protein
MAVTSVPGQQYGAGVEQQRLQKAMPAPKNQTPQVVAQAARQGVQQPAQQQPAQQGMNLAAIASELRGKVGMLGAPTNRPMEPVTTGLSRGPGAGPEVLGMMARSPLGEFMRMIARQSGDPTLAQLADRAGL